MHTRPLVGDDGAPRQARRWVSELVTASGMFLDTPHLVHDLTLCASELVNDALLAGSTTMTLALLLDHGIVRLSVLDGGDPDPPRSDSLHRAQVIGLRILDGIADRWGIDPAPDGGRELWAEFTLGPKGLPPSVA